MASPEISPNAAYAYQYYVKAGVPAHVAAGMVGSLMQESGGDLNSGATNPTSGAYGIAQVLGSRKTGYLAYAKSQGKPANDFTTQLDYTMEEANRGEGRAWSRMWSTKDPGQAAISAGVDYERPGTAEANNPARVANAQRVYDAMTAADAPTLYAEPPRAEPKVSDPATAPDANIDWLQSMAPTEKSATDAPAAPDANIDWLASMAPAEKPAPKVDVFGDPVGHGLYDDVIAPAASAAVSGAREAFGSAPLLDTNFWPGAPNQPGYSKAIDAVANHTIGPVLSLASRGMNALTGGVGEALGGGDLAALVTEPFMGGAGALAAGASAGMSAEARAAEVARLVTPEAIAANKLRGAATEPNMIGVARAEPAMTRAEMPAPTHAAPQSLSAAATPHELATMSPKELAAAEAGDNLKRLQTGGKTMDPSGEEYVPGSVPLPAEYGSNEDIMNHQGAIAKNPQYNKFVTDRTAENNDARLNYFGDIAGSPESVQARTAMLNDEFDKGVKQVFASNKPADASPVVSTINGILDGPDGKRSAVEKAMESVLASLKNRKTGELETDPKMLYGVRQHINDITSPEALRESPMSSKAVAALMQIKGSLDVQIEAAAPGFGELIKQYAEQRSPIDAMDYLQSKLPGLMNQGVISAAKFRNFMRDIYQQRKAGGILPATKLSADQLTALWNIDKDLQRTTRLGMTTGGQSVTSSNLAMFARMAGEGVLHSAASMLGPLGNIGVAVGKSAFKSAKEQKIINRLTGK